MAKIMQIKIVKCSIPGAWYSDKVGQEFRVSDNGGETGDCYGVCIDSLHKFWYVPMKDCELLKDVNCLTRSLWHWDKYGGEIIYDSHHVKVIGGSRRYWDHVEQFNPINLKEYGFECIKSMHEHALELEEIEILSRYFEAELKPLN